MEDPTVEFNLIAFQDVRSAPYSAARISRSLLHDRILFAHTNEGNYAKLQVQSGTDLRIVRLTVYNRDGCIVRTASNLTIRSSFSCDLDNARETRTRADFWWNAVSPSEYYLEPQNTATFHLCVGFEDVTFDDIRGTTFVARRVERSALGDQILFCRTSRGQFAKLLVEGGDTLRVRRLVVYRPDGSVSLDRSNIAVPRTYTLDVDTGNVGAAGYDLWWEVEPGESFFLTPANGATISFASYFRFEKYFPLLNNDAIRSAMVYVDAAGTRAYSHWSVAERLHLREFLYAREAGIELPIAGPPPLRDDHFMSACYAWKIYLAHVAQSLWVEAGARVSWRLTAASAEHLTHLFDMRKLMSFSPDRGHSFEASVMGRVTDWSPLISYAFLDSQSLVRTDQWSTIQAVADWCRANLVHITGFDSDPRGGPFASQADQYHYIYGYRGLPRVDKMIYPLPGRRRVTDGCWGTDGFLAAVLRTVNIPVRHGRTNFSDGSHSRAEFFTVGQNLAHGDDPYNATVRLEINNVPIHRVFYSNAQLTAEIDAPRPLPEKTVPETTSFNHIKGLLTLAVGFKTNYLLYARCQDRAAGTRATRVRDQLREYYTDAEIARIVSDCDTAIDAIAGGCAAIHEV